MLSSLQIVIHVFHISKCTRDSSIENGENFFNRTIAERRGERVRRSVLRSLTVLFSLVPLFWFEVDSFHSIQNRVLPACLLVVID